MTDKTKERPILFKGEMVREVLSDRKTQTRRIVKMPASWDSIVYADFGDGWWPYKSDDGESPDYDNNVIPLNCPYGKRGDRLYVRETWHTDVLDLIYARAKHEDAMEASPIFYRADLVNNDSGCTWKPSIHMPRWASRITLEITNVRIERLQDISGSDCISEGIMERTTYPPESDSEEIDRKEYRNLWESINGVGSWDKNPFVWVIEFKRIES